MFAGVVGVLVVNGLDGDHLPTLGVATSVGHAVAALPVTRLAKEYNLNNLSRIPRHKAGFRSIQAV